MNGGTVTDGKKGRRLPGLPGIPHVVLERPMTTTRTLSSGDAPDIAGSPANNC